MYAIYLCSTFQHCSWHYVSFLPLIFLVQALLRQKNYAHKVWPDQGSNPWPQDHDSTFCVPVMTVLTTLSWLSGTSTRWHRLPRGGPRNCKRFSCYHYIVSFRKIISINTQPEVDLQSLPTLGMAWYLISGHVWVAKEMMPNVFTETMRHSKTLNSKSKLKLYRSETNLTSLMRYCIGIFQLLQLHDPSNNQNLDCYICTVLQCTKGEPFS